ncbi:hypothetical protein O181_109783 [Austropuccinia psidii MF-1]|uniref:Uncharacterized protein n=1 Tax=Austropuccinia psidii MF-1 TaxID=1389203 RepID=A0A9Q3JVE1_9BASI|nr:hypothetical protein [Austropuccinia psidii MF-1]
MEEAIKSNPSDLDKEEVRPEQGLPSRPQERHIWRMPELPPIPQGNVLRDEPLSSGSHRNVSIPLQKLVQSSKRRGVGDMRKPLAGGNDLLIEHQKLSGSGEDLELLAGWSTSSCKDKELVEEPKSFICMPEGGIGNDPSIVRRPTGVYQLQTSSRSIQREAQRT